MKRGLIAGGMALGAVWAVLIVLVPQRMGLPFMPPALAFPLAFAAPGAVMALMIGRLAARRFFDDAIIDGAPLPLGSAAEIDQRVLTNTAEQMGLALLLWPFIGMSLGGGVVVAMGLGMALARLLFWIGYHVSPPLRALGFAASFYPTLFGAVWAAGVWLS